MANEEAEIIQKLRGLLGTETPPLLVKIDQENIRRWSDAVGDRNPLWIDPEYAEKARYGHTIAPPTFIIDRAIVPLADKIIAISPNFLNGGTEIEYFKPIKVGDTLTTTAKLADIKEKVGNAGKLFIMILEMTYKNQDGELVRKVKNTFIWISK